MKTLIVYAGKYGATAQAAELLKKALKNDAEVWDAGKGDIDPSGYENVVLGGSIYAGSLRKPMKQFVEKHKTVLEQKPLGLFIVCGSPSEAAKKYFEIGYGAELTAKAIAKGVFGGMFQFEKMNFFERFIIKQMQKGKEDSSQNKIDEAAIESFARELEENAK